MMIVRTVVKKGFILLSSSCQMFGRNAKPQHTSSEYQLSKDMIDRKTMSRIMRQIKSGNREKCMSIIDEQFYSNTFDSEKMVNEILPQQILCHFNFRDYPALLMAIENQESYIARIPPSIKEVNELIYLNQTLVQSRKILTYILYNCHKLKIFMLGSEQKRREMGPQAKKRDSVMTVAIRAYGHLVTGDWQRGQKYLLQILNKKVQQKQLDFNLFGKELTFKEIICINLLIIQAFKGERKEKRKALNLYKKIKAQQKLSLQDFTLQDYEQFLNILLSSKYDEPLEWQDLEKSELLPYLNYLYILAENFSLFKNHKKAFEILQFFPSQHPLRNFLNLSYLYDTNNHQKLHIQCQKFVGDKDNDYTKDPQFDLVYYNTLKIGSKSARKTQDEDLQAGLEQELILFKYQMNLWVNEENDLKGLPHYYLMIPFKQFLGVM